MKIIEANRAKEFASTFFSDPILKMAVNAVMDNVPGADAVQVVRCRDCKWFFRDSKYNKAWCEYYHSCHETAVNGYCYHGEKTEGNGNG